LTALGGWARFVLRGGCHLFLRMPPMKSQLLSAALAGSLLCALPAFGASSIDGYQWNKRLLITFAGDASSSALAKQRTLADDDKARFAERDLVAVEVVGETVRGASDSASDLRRRYGIAREDFRVLLIGKDGGVKMQSQEPIAPEKLFGTIDAMPMRKDEARRGPKS
jgi:hypothetical protein